MRALLDTHAFLWLISDESQLSSAARTYLRSADNPVLLSIASAWEVAIKLGRGRLELDISLKELLTDHLDQLAVELLPITASHLINVSSLPHRHRDPFDRLIVAQCLVEGIHLLSADAALDAYGITRIW